MSKNQNRSFSLLELVISLVLVTMIVLGVTSIQTFSRNHVITSDRRARLQNQLYYLLEHTSKNLSRAIGNEVIGGANSVIDINDSTGVPGETYRIKAYIDDGNGRRNASTPAEDYWIAYRYIGSGSGSNRYQVQYCGKCASKLCDICSFAGGWETIADNIISFIPNKPVNPLGILKDNFVAIDIKGRHDATKAIDINNPEISMSNRIRLPSVSLN